MKRSWGFLVTLIAVISLVEYYCYIAFRLSISSLNDTNKKWATVAYIVISVIGWGALFWLRYVSTHTFPRNVKALILASLFGFVVGKLLITVFMLLGDIYRFFQWISRSARSAPVHLQAENVTQDTANMFPRSVFLSRMALVVGGLMFGGFVWGTTNRYRYHLKKVKLTVKNLPEALKGLKLVQISDIHSGSFDNKEAVAAGVKMILEQKADLIVFTGDIVNDRAGELTPYLDVFSQLNAPLGVYSTLGNHDYGDYVEWESDAAKVANLNTLKQYHRDMGWKLMMNEHIILNKDGAEFALLGVENWSANPRFPRLGRLDEAYKGLEGKSLPLKILLSHDPSHWDAEVRKEYSDIDLTLSGHTHGMQFGIDLPWFKWSPVQYVYHQWAGLYAQDNQSLYVNRGYGFLGYQGRLGVLPEITVIEFA